MRFNQRSPLLAALFLTLVPTTLFSSTWYVDGVHGSDSNTCKLPNTACKTIGHAISLASSGDTVIVAAATYSENLTISKSLKIIGSGASTTIIDGGGKGTVVAISNTAAHVIVSNATVRNGLSSRGGGIFNEGTLTINNNTVNGNSATGGTSPGGGGIYNNGTLTINNSTVNGNSARSVGFSGGGGI